MDFQYLLRLSYTEKLLQSHMLPSLSCYAVIAFIYNNCSLVHSKCTVFLDNPAHN